MAFRSREVLGQVDRDRILRCDRTPELDEGVVLLVCRSKCCLKTTLSASNGQSVVWRLHFSHFCLEVLSQGYTFDRDVVSWDLRELAELDVVEYVENGRATTPRLKYNRIVVEPVVLPV